MAAQFSLWLARELLDHVHRKELWTPPYTNMWIGLATSNANLRANLLTDEISTSSTGYARVQIGVGSSNVWLVADTGGVTYLDLQLDFPQAVAAWGIVTTAFTIDTASGAGNIYTFFDVTPSRDVQTNDFIRFLDGQLWVGL